MGREGTDREPGHTVGPVSALVPAKHAPAAPRAAVTREAAASRCAVLPRPSETAALARLLARPMAEELLEVFSCSFINAPLVSG